MLEKRTIGTDDSLPTLSRYVYSNHLQSASLELDEEGDIISYEEYHPYGTTAFQAKNASINAVAKRYRYTGKERDEESGLYYHGARYYIPWLARWTTIDPMESKYAGMSPYNYSFNNPIMFNDLNGADAGDPPKDGDLRTDNGIEYVYSTSPDLNGNGGWNDLPNLVDAPVNAIVDDGLAQYSNNVKLSVELMMSNIPVVEQEPFSIKITPGYIPYEIRRIGVKLTHPTPVIDRGPTDYEERQRTFIKHEINKLKASHANPAFGTLHFFADGVMGTGDALYESYGNFSDGNLGKGTLYAGLGFLGVSGYSTGNMSKGFISGFEEILVKTKLAKKHISALGEIEAAKYLREQGINVHFQTPGQVKSGAGGTADFIVGGAKGTGKGGIVYDVYTPTTNNINNVVTNSAKKNSQAKGVILNLKHTSLNPSDFSNILQRIHGKGKTNIQNVIIIK